MNAWLARLSVVAIVVLHAVTGPWVRAPAIPTRPHDGARIVSWNLRNFPEPDEDLDHIRATVDQLDADIWVLQEIVDPSVLRRVWPDATIHVSDGGGRGGQHLAIVLPRGRALALGPAREWSQLTAGGRVRPALALGVLTRAGPLQLVDVHLKSGRDGADLRREQWSHLRAAIAEDTTAGPWLVAGDFNLAGSRTADSVDEHARLATTLDEIDLRPLVDVGQCTSYWEGVRRDHWWVGSGLDAAYLSRAWPHASAWIGGACARHQCDPIHNAPSHPDPDLSFVSDHCPLVIDLAGNDDDGWN